MKAIVAVVLMVSAALVSGPILLSGPSTTRSSSDPLECEDLVQGQEIEVETEEAAVGVERELEVRAEADTRVRIRVEAESEAEVDTEDSGSRSSDDSASSHEEDEDEDEQEQEMEREARVELCGFVHFVDDGDGILDANDTVVNATLVEFDSLEQTVENGERVFVAGSTEGNMTVTARVPASFPAEDMPLIRWRVEANPACAAGATHYAVKLEQKEPTDVEQFFVAACGSTLEAEDEA